MRLCWRVFIGRVSLRECGRPTRPMRRSGILRAPGRRRGTIFGESVSGFFLSSCGTAGFTGVAATGRWRIGVGSPVRRSTMPREPIVFQEGIDAIEDSLQRLRRVEKQLGLVVPEWSMAPVVQAYQAMRGASFLVAVIFAAEIGDVRRFDTPRQLTSFLGLVPAESSTGDTIRRKGLTLAGNRRARRALVEAAWTYRYPRVSETLRARLEGLPKPRARHRLEGAGPSVRPLSPPQRHGQEAARRRGRDRPRNGRFPVGHRTGSRARVNRTLSAAQTRERSTKGGELPSLVTGPGLAPTPVL